jgi:hypothetical protein
MKYERQAFSKRRSTSGVITPAVSIGSLLGAVTINSAFDILVVDGNVVGSSSDESELSEKAFCLAGVCMGGSADLSNNGTAAGNGDGTEGGTEDRGEGEGDGSIGDGSSGGETILATRLTTRPRLACPTSLAK